MKKLFNHSKREYKKNLEWDDAEYTEDDNRIDNEDYIDEYDVDDDSEYYDDDTVHNKNHVEYETLEDGEYYEEETAQDGEYYEEETAQDDEYYEEETAQDGEYYEEETAEEVEYYEEETLEDGEYYEEGTTEDGEYYEDEVTVDNKYYEDDFINAEEEDLKPYREKRKTEKQSTSQNKKKAYNEYDDEQEKSPLDKIVAFTGILVLVLALATGGIFLGSRLLPKEANSFKEVGTQLNGVTVIGEHGLTAIADKELAKIMAANEMEQDEPEEPTDYNENEFLNEVEVALGLTSIEKDLKIKFTNSSTKKLIANVPFVVKITLPNGKTENWTDDDMDGIIYKKDITPGEYSVLIEALTDSKYENYKLPVSGKKVTVKKEIEYQKVEVSDEIKKENEVNSKIEDTKENETVVESTLSDTVAWVESTRTVLDAVYTPVLKNTIKDPLAVAKRDVFMRTAVVNPDPATNPDPSTNPSTQGTDVAVDMPGSLNLTVGTGGVPSGSARANIPSTHTDFTISLYTGKSTYYESSDTTVATVSEDGTVTALKVGTTTINYIASATKTTPSSVSGADPVVVTDTLKGSCTVTVTNVVPATVPVATITLNKTNFNLIKGQSETLTVTVLPDTATDKTVTWSSSDAAIVSVDTTGKITALKTGKATITATSVSTPTVKGSVEVTVPAETRTLVLDPKGPVTTVLGTPIVIKATIGNSVSGGNVAGLNDPQVTVAGIIEWTKGMTTNGITPITITPKAVGTTKLTITTTDGLTATCDITVTNKELKLDKQTLSVIATGKNTVVAEVQSLGGEFKVETTDAKIATATVTATKGTDKTTAKVEITGIAAGSATITISHTENGVIAKKTCTVTVVNKEIKLVDDKKRQLYVLQSDGKYREAVYADYYDEKVTSFFIREEGLIKYTGWQTIDNKLYYFDASGKKVTGEQVIQGAKYNFASDGSLIVGSGSFGIDVSKWNGTIDWNAVKNSGVNYVIIRCGYRGSSTGVLVEDPKFQNNIKGATAAGIKVGVYFFSQAVNRNEAVEEASMVLELIRKYTISYPVFLDVEASGGRGDGVDKATRTDVIKAFCETVQNGGYTAGVYANKSWLTNKIDASQLGRYKIWLAQYASAPTYTGRYDIWQYKSTGKVSGISGNVDLNLSYLGY